MPISHEHELILIHVPKNAGTAIQKAFDMGDMTGHYTAQQYKDQVPELWEEYTSIALVRNPFDRAVSAYEYAVKEKSYWHDNKNPGDAIYGKHPDYDTLKGKSFAEALDMLPQLKHQGWHKQVRYVFPDEGEPDAIVRYEALSDNINHVCAKAGIEDPPEIPVINKSSDSDWKSRYENCENCVQIVRDYYKEDFTSFNYSYQL